MTEHLLEADSIFVELGGRKLLTDIYWQCRTGEVLGLLGRNGSGKSTLLKVLFGTQAAPNRSIRVDGRHLKAAALRGRWVSFLPQHSFLPGNLSVRRVVSLSIPDKGLVERIAADERVGPHWGKKMRTLSGGELRYLEVLLLLNLPAPFVLLDEPFSGIEPLYQERLIELIREYRGWKGIVISDHSYRAVVAISDRLLLLENGRVVAIRQKEELEARGYLPRGTFTTGGAGAALFRERRSFGAGDTDSDPVAKSNVFIDKQTFKDLDLFDQGRRGLVFELFNKTIKTVGGGDALERLLKTPSNVLSVLEARREVIRWFAENGSDLRVDRESLNVIEHYCSSGIGLFPDVLPDAWIYTLRNQFKPSPHYYTVTNGVRRTVGVLRQLFRQTQEWMDRGCPAALAGMVVEMVELMFDSRVKALVFSSSDEALTTKELARCDRFFRGVGKDSLRRIIEIVYELDAFAAVGGVALDRGFCFPAYRNGGAVRAMGLFHPLVAKPVSNDYQMGGAANLCFISGANMAGKSTFLKSFGLSVYLAHVGFPVPARSFETDLFNGLITTINLADNISQGYSHYYTEVRRVKEVVMKVRDQQKMVVIFDELFRGTNVKDASDASLQVIDGLAGISGSLFLVSTHIVEVAAALQRNPHVFFVCFESSLEGGVPWYSYKLRSGVSGERMGMLILTNEGVLEMLREMKGGRG
jgi:ABC-type multidrug transport system ATPase subunit